MTVKNFELSHNFELTVSELTGSNLYRHSRGDVTNTSLGSLPGDAWVRMVTI